MQQVEIINGAVDFLEVLTSINAARLKKGGEWHGLYTVIPRYRLSILSNFTSIVIPILHNN